MVFQGAERETWRGEGDKFDESMLHACMGISQ
jgi:hypothetical protein